jgi:hypothetical protein
MHKVEEHRRLPEHKQRAVFTHTDHGFKFHHHREQQAHQPEFERGIAEGRRILAHMQPLLPGIAGARQGHVAVTVQPTDDDEQAKCHAPGDEHDPGGRNR